MNNLHDLIDSKRMTTKESTLLVTSVPELEAAFRNVLSQLLDEREQERLAHEEARRSARISRAAACKRLNKDASTLFRWERSGMLHPIHIGRNVFYPESEIINIEEGRIS